MITSFVAGGSVLLSMNPMPCSNVLASELESELLVRDLECKAGFGTVAVIDLLDFFLTVFPLSEGVWLCLACKSFSEVCTWFSNEISQALVSEVAELLIASFIDDEPGLGNSFVLFEATDEL